MSATIELDVSEVMAALGRLMEAAGTLQPVLGEIGRTMVEAVTYQFEAGQDPYGVPWSPLKYREGRPLVDTGTLKRSFIARAMNDTAEVGTGLEYAVIHQFGGQAGRDHAVTVPARPMLPTTTLPDDWRADIEGVIRRHLATALGSV